MPTSGASGATPTVKVTANTSTAARTGVITVRGEGNAQATFTVTQAGFVQPAFLEIDLPSSWNFKGIGDAVGTFVRTDQASWTASSTASWLTVYPSSGVNGTWLAAKAEANTRSSPRFATLTVQAGNAKREVLITQAGAVETPSINLSSYSWEPASTSSAGGFYVYTNQPSWTAASNQAWLTLSASSGSSGAWLVAYTTANTSGSPRTATVTVRAGSAEPRYVHVTQAGR